MEPKKMEEYEKEIYLFAQNRLNNRYENKRHIEIKTLYVIQAAGAVVTLFTALYSKYGTEVASYKMWISFFYILLGISLFTLLISLFDDIASRFWCAKLLLIGDKSVETGEKLVPKTEKERYYFIDTPEPYDQLISNLDEMINDENFYTTQVKNLSDSTKRLTHIIQVKDALFKFGTGAFVTAIVILVILGLTFI